MEITFTQDAAEAVRGVSETRSGLVMVLSNGCCDSTAPFLYDDHIPEAGSEQVGIIEGVAILAPAWIRALYPNDSLMIDVIRSSNEDSFSLETDLGCRFVLRAPGNDGLG